MRNIFIALSLVIGVVFGLMIFKKSPATHKECQEVLRVGVTAGPHAVIMDKVREVALANDLHIEVVEFNDFILPNEALDNGDIDVNVYQHELFLQDQIKNRKYEIESLGKSVLMPMGVYSQKIKTLSELPEGAKVAIPSDPSNGSRALLLLEKGGIIKLSQQTNPSLRDISDNPKNIQIIELEAPQLPRSLEDVDAAVINTDWVIVSKLPIETQIYREDENSPYVNVVAAKKDSPKQKLIDRFLSHYQSEATREYVEKVFKGMVTPGW
jgi:D-methionine transport system substrate-binding protein